MHNILATDKFSQKGGTELAPMLTTTDIFTAVSYLLSSDSLIFHIVTANALQRWADLQWLSAFAAEAEILYSPLVSLSSSPLPPAHVRDVDLVCRILTTCHRPMCHTQTYLQPTGRRQVIELDSKRFTVVEVYPTSA
jgi:hypothetical protein